MYRFLLPGPRCQLELVGLGVGRELSFQILGPSTEASFVEELICQHFGSLRVLPKSLFLFLVQDPWIGEFFQAPELVSGDLEAIDISLMPCFSDQPLGLKLVEAGVLDKNELDQLLLQYQSLSTQFRFGEFLRLNHRIPHGVIRFFLEPDFFQRQGFYQMPLGQRLCSLGLIENRDLISACQQEQDIGGALAETLINRGFISPVTANFFQAVYVDETGRVHLSESPV